MPRIEIVLLGAVGLERLCPVMGTASFYRINILCSIVAAETLNFPVNGNEISALEGMI